MHLCAHSPFTLHMWCAQESCVAPTEAVVDDDVHGGNSDDDDDDDGDGGGGGGGGESTDGKERVDSIVSHPAAATNTVEARDTSAGMPSPAGMLAAADDATDAADVAAADRLLPDGAMPAVALRWVQRDRRRRRSSQEATQQRDAVEWVLAALCYAHADTRLKQAVRKLLAVRYFTANLDAGGAWLFTDVLRPGLRARLLELGGGLLSDYDARGLAVSLGNDVVSMAVRSPDQHPLARARGDGQLPSQIDVLPCGAPIDLTKPEEFPDEACV